MYPGLVDAINVRLVADGTDAIVRKVYVGLEGGRVKVLPYTNMTQDSEEDESSFQARHRTQLLRATIVTGKQHERQASPIMDALRASLHERPFTVAGVVILIREANTGSRSGPELVADDHYEAVMIFDVHVN